MTSRHFKTTPERSAIMSHIRSRNTKIELRLRKALWSKGYRYRIHVKTLLGSPDVVFTRLRLAVFCDSDFWHGRNWEQKRLRIKSNRPYWIAKIENNMKRDRAVTARLRASGWSVLRLSESDIEKHTDACILLIEKRLSSRQNSLQPKRSTRTI